jgi:hypothetical protein
LEIEEVTMHVLLASIALAFSLAAAPAQTSSAQQPPQKKPKKVWTNDDLDLLRGGLSVAGGSASGGGVAGGAAAGEEKPAGKDKLLPSEKDPKTYREKLAPLRAQLEQIDAKIKLMHDQLTHPVEGGNAVDLSHASVTMRPEAALQELEQKRQGIQQKISDLEDEARRNGLSSGDIR